MNPSTSALAQLPQAQRINAIAQLKTADGKIAYQFLYNPEEISHKRSANYSPAGVALVAGQALEWTGSEAQTLSIPDLLLDGYDAGKVVKPIIDGLYALLDPVPGTLNPPVVFFHWGTRLIGPARLIDVDVTETGWLQGQVAIARCSLTLQKIPAVTAAAAAPAAPSAAVNLTDRQQAEATTRASEWLDGNLSLVSQTVREAVQAGAASYSANSSGLVTLLRRGNAVATVGSWDGFTWRPSEEIQI